MMARPNVKKDLELASLVTALDVAAARQAYASLALLALHMGDATMNIGDNLGNCKHCAMHAYLKTGNVQSGASAWPLSCLF